MGQIDYESYTGSKTFNRKTKLFECSHRESGKLGYRTYKSGYILPGIKGELNLGGVNDEEQQWVENTSLHDKDYGNYNIDGNSIAVSHETVVYIGLFCKVWGHLITDDIKRCWFLYTDEWMALKSKGCKLAFVTEYNYDLPNYCYELLSLLGVEKEDLHHIRNATKFDQIIIPDVSFHNNPLDLHYSYHIEYGKVISIIKENVLSLNIGMPTFEKIYFTRRGLKERKDFGEKSIENLFKNRGFKIISPEKISVVEQIFLLINCSEFATTEGSISHNIIFCQPNTKICILVKHEQAVGLQSALDLISNCNVTYVDANKTLNMKRQNDGPFFLYCTSHLKKFLGMKFSNFTLPYYLRFGFYNYLCKSASRIYYRNAGNGLTLDTTISILHYLRMGFKKMALSLQGIIQI